MTSTADRQPPNDSNGQKEALEALAQMTGYRDETKKRDLVDKANPASESQLLDPEDLDDSDVGQTETPVWSNPIAKGLFVAIITGACFGLLGLFIASMNRHTSTQETVEQPVDPSNPIESAEERQRAEIGRLKTTAALGSQMATLNQNSRNAGARIRPQVPNQAAQPQAVPVRPSPIPAPQPQPIGPPRSAYSSPPRFSPAIPSRPSAPVSAPIPPAAATPPVDPQQAWLAVQSLGSYGQTSATIGTSAEPALSSAQASPSAEVANPGLATDSRGLVTDSRSDQSQYEADSTALLSGVAPQIALIAPGATAKAELTTPVIWAQDMNASDQPQRFNIQLSEPIYDQNGAVAFPEGTILVASVASASDSGLLVLAVNNAIVSTNHGEQIVSIPDGSIQISTDGGKPLVAKDYHRGNSQLLGRDIETTLLGALANVGSLLNRPTNQTTTSSPYFSSTSVSNNRTNIVGGILEGGFSALQSSLSQRQQTQIQAILSRPHIWYIPQGQEVQIFVNQQIQLQF
jgi:Bacterial conjugation TrbI-like protein